MVLPACVRERERATWRWNRIIFLILLGVGKEVERGQMALWSDLVSLSAAESRLDLQEAPRV